MHSLSLGTPFLRFSVLYTHVPLVLPSGPREAWNHMYACLEYTSPKYSASLRRSPPHHRGVETVRSDAVRPSSVGQRTPWRGLCWGDDVVTLFVGTLRHVRMETLGPQRALARRAIFGNRERYGETDIECCMGETS